MIRKFREHKGWIRAILLVILVFSCVSCIRDVSYQENASGDVFSESAEECREEYSADENTCSSIAVPIPDDPRPDDSIPEVSEEQSIHVHTFVTVQRVMADAYDETATVTDKAAWDEIVTITDSEAWDELVTLTDREAWDEVITVVDQEAWDETVTIVDEEAYDYVSEEIPGFRCRCEAFFSAADDGLDGSIAVNAHQKAMTEQIDAKYYAIIDDGQWEDGMLAEWDAEAARHGGYADSCEYVYTHVDAVTHDETVHHEAVTHEETIHHDAVTHEETVHHEPLFHTEPVHHPAETHTETVHHDAVYETVYVCAECGAVKE